MEQKSRPLYTECHTPEKSRFATQEAADRAVKTASFELNKTLYTYDTCPCGWIHLTSKKNRVKETPSLTGMVDLTDEVFAQVVRDDVRGVAHAEDSAALRHPENLLRWRGHLRMFQVDLEKQLAKKSGDTSPEIKEWRKRIQVVRMSAARANEECKALIAAYREEKYKRKKEIKEQRHEAGERAIRRLVDAHQSEFQQYLVEECEVLGVELPRNVRRYVELDELEKETS